MLRVRIRVWGLEFRAWGLEIIKAKGLELKVCAFGIGVYAGDVSLGGEVWWFRLLWCPGVRLRVNIRVPGTRVQACALGMLRSLEEVLSL